MALLRLLRFAVAVASHLARSKIPLYLPDNSTVTYQDFSSGYQAINSASVKSETISVGCTGLHVDWFEGNRAGDALKSWCGADGLRIIWPESRTHQVYGGAKAYACNYSPGPHFGACPNDVIQFALENIRSKCGTLGGGWVHLEAEDLAIGLAGRDEGYCQNAPLKDQF